MTRKGCGLIVGHADLNKHYPMNARVCLLIALLIVAATGCGGVGTIRAPRFDDLPASAQAKIQEQTDPGRITRIEKESDAGRSVYHVAFTENGEIVKVSVTETGTIISDSRNRVIHEPAGAPLTFGRMSAQSRFNSLPTVVQRAVGLRSSGNIEIVNVRTTERDGAMLYEIEFDSSGRNPKMFIMEDGSVLEDQRDAFRQ
jgi:hypothetical protein